MLLNFVVRHFTTVDRVAVAAVLAVLLPDINALIVIIAGNTISDIAESTASP